jgi:hypothetical protein
MDNLSQALNGITQVFKVDELQSQNYTVLIIIFSGVITPLITYLLTRKFVIEKKNRLAS